LAGGLLLGSDLANQLSASFLQVREFIFAYVRIGHVQEENRRIGHP
jgi:hypothetical protein